MNCNLVDSGLKGVPRGSGGCSDTFALHQSYNFYRFGARGYVFMNTRMNHLFEIVQSQQGYFTSAQAVACEYPSANHAYHLRTGSWQRAWRGIYRLVRYPATAESQYVLWSLWSRNKRQEPLGVHRRSVRLQTHQRPGTVPSRFRMPPESARGWRPRGRFVPPAGPTPSDRDGDRPLRR